MVMGLLVGGLATAVIERLVSVASTHIEGYFKQRKGMKEELRRLKMLLPQIQSVVDWAERREQQNSDRLQKWLWQLKDALYEADDVLDELDYLQLKQQAGTKNKEQHKLREFMSRSKSKAIELAKHCKLIPDPTLERLRGAVNKLDEVAAGVASFVALVSNVQREGQQQSTQINHNRKTGRLLTANKVFGREKERDKLLKWLTMMPADHVDEFSDTNVSVFSVVGHGGMGKTTLAQLVFKDQIVQDSFDLKMWVPVSTSFDVTGLTRYILA